MLYAFSGTFLRRFINTVALVTAGCMPASLAAPSGAAQIEIDHLFAYLAESPCRFNRNGTWYVAHEARDHLKKKYDYLMRKGLLNSAESFIDLAASRSSVSGEPYLVQCPGTPVVPSAVWFKDELLRFRRATR
jgi:hypothetical protein